MQLNVTSMVYSFFIDRKQASLWIQGDIFKTRQKDVNENGKMKTMGAIDSVSMKASE